MTWCCTEQVSHDRLCRNYKKVILRDTSKGFYGESSFKVYWFLPSYPSDAFVRMTWCCTEQVSHEDTRSRIKVLTAWQVAAAEDSGTEPEHQSGQHGDGKTGGEVQPLPDQKLDRFVIGEWIDRRNILERFPQSGD